MRSPQAKTTTALATRLATVAATTLAVLFIAMAAFAYLVASSAFGERAQRGNLRVAVTGQLAPRALPRTHPAPIAVTIGGEISTTNQSLPPQLKTMRIEINRHGHLNYRGLPVCNLRQINPASSARAFAACKRSLVGKGTFTAQITLAGQQPYPAKGKLLLFYGRRRGHPVLLGHIYSPYPFATSFVITFMIRHRPHGNYGPELIAAFPKTLGKWGNLTGITMRLHRLFSFGGRRQSFLSAACSAPKGFPGALFILARTTFGFAGGPKLTSTLTRNCRVR